MGCKGPVAFFNCPTVRWNEGTSWPVAAGHGCIGCALPDFWDFGAYNLADLQEVTPPTTFAPVEQSDFNISPAAAAAVGATVGVAAGVAGTIAVRGMHRVEPEEEASEPAAPAEEPPASPEV
jgi:hydrogenase small subunit